MTNQTKWSIDQTHSNIAFKVIHLMIAYINGTFKMYDASIYTKDKNFENAEIELKFQKPINWFKISFVNLKKEKWSEEIEIKFSKFQNSFILPIRHKGINKNGHIQ